MTSPGDANERKQRDGSPFTEAREVEPPPPPPAAEDEPLVSIGDALAEAFKLMDDRAEGREKPIATPWVDLNDQLPGDGLYAGCHVLVSGPGIGKTTVAMQLLLSAARNGVPSACVGLEIDKPQSALRVAGEQARVGWSRAYTGKASEDERTKIHETKPDLAKLPFYLESGTAMGWPASKLEVLVKRMRRKHPAGPMLIVVDFLQLIGTDPNADRRQDLRERIGQAAYAARMVAANYGVTVLLISSVAREAYAKVRGFEALQEAGIALDEEKGVVVERYLLAAEVLVGLGKESGEIEFAADSVIVAISLPREARKSERLVVFAVAKVRAGAPGWCSLRFDGFRFDTDPTHGKDVILAFEGWKEQAKQRSVRRRRQLPTNGRSSTIPPSRDLNLGDDDDEAEV